MEMGNENDPFVAIKHAAVRDYFTERIVESKDSNHPVEAKPFWGVMDGSQFCIRLRGGGRKGRFSKLLSTLVGEIREADTGCEIRVTFLFRKKILAILGVLGAISAGLTLQTTMIDAGLLSRALAWGLFTLLLCDLEFTRQLQIRLLNRLAHDIQARLVEATSIPLP